MDDPITNEVLRARISEMREANEKLRAEVDEFRALMVPGEKSHPPHSVELTADDPNRGRMCPVCDHPIPRGQRYAHLEWCQRTHPDKYPETVPAEELTQAHLDKSAGIWHTDGSWTPIDPDPATDPVEKVDEQLGAKLAAKLLDKRRWREMDDGARGLLGWKVSDVDREAANTITTDDSEANPERVSCIGCTSFWARKSRCQSVPDDDGPGRFVDISDDARNPIPYWCPGRTPKDDEVEPSIDREVIGTATVDDGGMWSPDECSCLLSVSLQRKFDKLTEVHRYDCASYEASYRKLADRMRAFCRAVLDESPGDTKAMTLDSWTGKAIDAARRHRRIAEGLDGES